MKINALSPKSHVSFGAYIAAVDVGASSVKGSFKIELRDEHTGEVFAQGKNTVFTDHEYRDEKGFENNFANNVINFAKENQDLIKKHDPYNEGMILLACFPGPAVKGGYNLTNFFYGKGEEKDGKFKQIINTKKIDNLIQNEINFNKSYYANDMAPAGASIVNKLKEDPQYSELLAPGENILYLYPGGGLGSGEISVGNNEIKVHPSEMQHMLSYGSDGKSVEERVKAPVLRENFAKALGVDVNVLDEKTEAVTTYDKLNELLKLHNQQSKTKAEFELASKTAISEFMEGLAQVIAMKTADSNIKSVVLTGPIINGVRNSVAENSQFAAYEFNSEFLKKYDFNTSKDDQFAKILKDKVYNNLVQGRQKLFNPNNFNVIFLNMQNNNEGAHLLAKSEQVGEIPAWYNLDVKPAKLDTRA